MSITKYVALPTALLSVLSLPIKAEDKSEATSFFEQLAAFVGEEAPEKIEDKVESVVTSIEDLPFTDPIDVTETLDSLPSKLEDALEAPVPRTPQADLEAVADVVSILVEAAEAVEVASGIDGVDAKPLEVLVENIADKAPGILAEASAEAVEALTQTIEDLAGEASKPGVDGKIKEAAQDVLELTVTLEEDIKALGKSDLLDVESSVSGLVDTLGEIAETAEDISSDVEVGASLEAVAEDVAEAAGELLETLEPVTPEPVKDLTGVVNAAVVDEVVTPQEVEIVQEAVLGVVQEIEAAVVIDEPKDVDPEVLEAVSEVKESIDTVVEVVATLDDADSGPELAELSEAVVKAVEEVRDAVEEVVGVATVSKEPEIVEQFEEVDKAVKEVAEVIVEAAKDLDRTETAEMSLAEAVRAFLELPSSIELSDKNSARRVDSIREDIAKLEKALQNVGRDRDELKAKLSAAESTLKAAVSLADPIKIFDLGMGRVFVVIRSGEEVEFKTLATIPLD